MMILLMMTQRFNGFINPKDEACLRLKTIDDLALMVSQVPWIMQESSLASLRFTNCARVF